MFNRKTLAMILHDVFKHRAISFILGLFIAIVGAAIFIGNKVTDGLTQFVEIIAWMIFIKGVIYMFFPEIIRNMMKSFSKATYFLGGLAVVVVGIYLVFFL